MANQVKQITLFSESDLNGTIAFVNEAFCEVSKYTQEELIGKPHSIIRHPDMPQKLFRQLWLTIKQGKTFRAIIKNRAKDSSHYWVQCTIMPILDNDQQVIKYISVRHLVADEQLATALYSVQEMQLLQ